jgi:hypothetical protein
MDNERRMAALRAIQRLLDSAFRVPGTTIRFGWDPIVGVVPWAGDVLTALFSCTLIVHAHRLRLPRVVQLRMLFNVAIDIAIGSVPLLGDVADIFWKSNARNMALLERHAALARPTTTGDWLFVGSVVAAVLAIAVVPLLVVYWLLGVVGRTIWS